MAGNELILKRIDELEQQICTLQKTMKEDHDKIFMAADDTRELSDSIQEVLDNFKGFSATIKFVRGILITAGLLWLIFKDVIMKTFV